MDSLLDTFQRWYSSLTAVISEEALITFGGISIVMFVGTIIAIPIILNRLPANYFQHELEQKWMDNYHPIFRNIGLVVKNTVGLVFLLAGMAMLVLPGQGILTIVIGVSLLDFPGKQKLEHKLLTQPMVFQAMNSIRAKCSKPPFNPPSKSTFS